MPRILNTAVVRCRNGTRRRDFACGCLPRAGMQESSKTNSAIRPGGTEKNAGCRGRCKGLWRSVWTHVGPIRGGKRKIPARQLQPERFKTCTGGKMPKATYKIGRLGTFGEEEWSEPGDPSDDQDGQSVGGHGGIV